MEHHIAVENLLFMRTFYIVGGMLLVTAITSKFNRTFSTLAEFWITLISTFVILFTISAQADNYPLNLILVALFAALNGWMIGPTIEMIGERFKLKKHLKNEGIKLKRRKHVSKDALSKFEESFNRQDYHTEWQNLVFQAMTATALAVFTTGTTVYLTDYDFGWMGQLLFICLFILIMMSILNILFFKSRALSLLRAYLGAVLFTFYLLFDFHRLKISDDDSWAKAIDISVNIYLDIINLFLEILQILADSN